MRRYFRGLGAQRCLRCRSLLGALVSRIVYVTVRSWEPWRCELVTSPFAVGSLGVTSFLRYRSLFYWASLSLFWGPLEVVFGAHLGCLGALLGQDSPNGSSNPPSALSDWSSNPLDPKTAAAFIFCFFVCLRPIGQRRSSCRLASRARASSCDLAEPVHLELRLNLPLEFRGRGSRLHRDLDLAPAPSWVPLSFSLPPLPSSILLHSFPRFPLL